MKFFETGTGALINSELVRVVEVVEVASNHMVVFHFDVDHYYSIGCSSLMSAERQKKRFEEFVEICFAMRR